MRISSLVESPDYVSVSRQERYAVILAGGDGTRLKSLTRVIAGDDRPKQFCRILNNDTLLELTQKRVALRVRPENTFYSLISEHKGFYEPLLRGVSERQFLVQPENKGTAPAILYSLQRLSKFAPGATVAFFPSDHYFSDDETFMGNVEIAFNEVEVNSGSIILLGIEPEKPETSYGWIESIDEGQDGSFRKISRVKRFWEKPTFKSAQFLMTKGCLWNSFVMVGKVSSFLKMIRRNVPNLVEMFDDLSHSLGSPFEPSHIRLLYSWIDDVNFSKEVLEKSSEYLSVLRVSDVGWSDLGEPQRVLGTLADLGVQTKWMASEIKL